MAIDDDEKNRNNPLAPPVTVAPRRPTQPSTPTASPTIGERTGAVLRAGVDQQLDQGRQIVDAGAAALRGTASAINAVNRGIAGFGQEVRSGFTAQNPVPAQPVATPRPGFVMDRPAAPNVPVTRAPLPPRPAMPTAALQPGAPATPSAMMNPPPNTFVGSRTGVRTLDPATGAIPGIAGIPAPTPAAAAPVQPLAAPPATAMPPQPAAAAPAPPAPAAVPRQPVQPIAAASGAIPPPGIPQRPSVAAPARADAARQGAESNFGASLDPRSYEFELRRRANIIADSSFGTSMSRARAQADLLGEGAGYRAGQRERALDAQQGANALTATEVQEGGQNDRAVLDQAGANTRALLEDTGATERTGLNLASQEREGAAARAQRPTMTLADGTVGLVGQDGTLQPVIGADGQPVRATRPTTPGQITPEQRFKAYSDERTAIQNSILPADEKTASLAALDQDPRFADILAPAGGAAAQPSAGPTLEQFLSAARPINPGMTDAQLREQYAQKYGR